VAVVSVLAEALLAAQRQAIGALEKQYVAGTMDVPTLCEWLDTMGCRDVIEQGQLLAALNALKEFGIATPTTSGKPDPENELASQKQLLFLARLADEKHTMPPDGPLSKARASEAIQALQKGTYNVDEWTAPF
jgi:hypothetical protein